MIKALYTDVPVHAQVHKRVWYDDGSSEIKLLDEPSRAYTKLMDVIETSIRSGYYVSSSVYTKDGDLKISCRIQDTPFDDQGDGV